MNVWNEYLRPDKNITDFKTSGQKYSNVIKTTEVSDGFSDIPGRRDR